VYRLAPETTSADLLKCIHQEFPPQNISLEEFKFPHVHRISSLKLFDPPEVLNELNSKRFWLNVELVINEFFANMRRTKNRPSMVVPGPKN